MLLTTQCQVSLKLPAILPPCGHTLWTVLQEGDTVHQHSNISIFIILLFCSSITQIQDISKTDGYL